MVLIIGTGWRAESSGTEADSLLRLPPLSAAASRRQARARTGQGRQGEFYDGLGGLPLPLV